MWILLAILAAGALIALSIGYGRERLLRKRIRSGELQQMPDVVLPTDNECCGQHEVCEKDSLLAAVSRKVEYYDDEELDRYIGTLPAQYTGEQIEEFRDVLYTMQEVDVAGWVRSLQLRGICLPDALKDEVFLVLGERRQGVVRK
ncbi:MAG: phospholipase [Prevotellaceae bacterium]|jgi:hypothetical protein|nr:phospholipase [Prevotellaceae bacterium]